MQNRLVAVLAIIVLFSMTTSYSFACFNPPDSINKLGIEFAKVAVEDNELNYDAANAQAQISTDRHSISIKLTNAYPDYQAQIKYTLKNTGRSAIQFSVPTIDNPSPSAIEVITTNHRYAVLQPGQSIQGITSVRVLWAAEENHMYTFQIRTTTTLK